MSDEFLPDQFQAGFAARHSAAAALLHQAFAPESRPFEPQAPGSAPGDRPRSFSPADRAANPTAGWNPLDPNGSASGYLDPIATAHAAGFAEGEAAALASVTARAAADQALLETLAHALARGRPVDRDLLARRLRQTVLHLVAKLIGEAGVSAELLLTRVGAATDLLADAAESALLRLNPADMALVEGRLPATVFAAGDAAVARGSFVLESASTVIEDGPDLWLDQLAAAIDRAAVPPAC
ncbi:FliH/SctL family protein [Sphingomonas sp.]|uniref:FliH/SctL family protein n=1 Tax=Sphingomonas sp. TaxID=28214 RepID=UPI003CC62926